MRTSPFQVIHSRVLGWLARNGQDKEGTSTVLTLRYHDESTGGLTTDAASVQIVNTTRKQWAIHRPAQRKIGGYDDGGSLNLYEIWIAPGAISATVAARAICVDCGPLRYKIEQKLEANGVDGLWRGVLRFDKELSA